MPETSRPRRRHGLPAAAGRAERGRDARALDQKIHADNGATDYNGAFAESDVDNPSADARIFLTDGGHNVGTYNEGHLIHNVPDLRDRLRRVCLPEDQARLKKIASDTGGNYFPLDDSSQLQSVMNSIGAALTCQTPPRLFTDQLKQARANCTASRSAPRPSRFRSR